jgi:hypothetical protein
VAPKVASAPRGPGTGRLAGYLVQSLPGANRPFGHFLFAISQSIHVGFSSLFFTPLYLGILPANRLFLEFKPIRLPIVLLLQRFLFLPLSSHV